jgi:NAD(P)H-hydrate epimerase
MTQNRPPLRLSRAQVREVDRRSIEDYHIPGIVLMENASRGVADVCVAMLGANATAPVAVVCGGGNNGGDGLAVARHLHNRGFAGRVFTAFDPVRLKGDALTNWRIVEAMDLPRRPATPELLRGEFALIVDALFGTGLDRPPGEPHASLIRAINGNSAPVVAIDLPSGLDCDAGVAYDPCVRAAHTVTFVAEKIGFTNPAAREYLGRLTVADIGCPVELIRTCAAEVVR